MSVLNQMLRDLEARAAPLPAAAAGVGSVGSALPPTAASAPASPLAGARAANRLATRRLLWFGLAAPALGLAGAVSWVEWQPDFAPSPHGMAQYGAALDPAASGAPARAASVPTLTVAGTASDTAARPPGGTAAATAAARPAAGGMAAAALTSTAGAPTMPAATAATTGKVAAAARAATATTVAAATAAPTAAPAKAASPAPPAPATAALPAPAGLAAARAAAHTGSAAPPPPTPAALVAAPTAPITAVAPAEAPVRRSAASLAEADAEIARAAALIARGRNAEAMDLLRTLLARRPLHAEAREALAALLAEADRRHEALVLLLEGASLDAPRFALRAAQVQQELGDAAGALATLQRVPPARRNGAQHALAGGIALRLGDAGAAVDAYRQALAAPDAQPVWWIGLALAQEAGGQFGAARDSLARAARQPALDDELRRFIGQRLATLPATVAGDGAPVAGMLR